MNGVTQNPCIFRVLQFNKYAIIAAAILREGHTNIYI